MSESVSFSRAARIAGIDVRKLNVWKQRYPEIFESEYFSPPKVAGKAGEVDRPGVIFLSVIGRLTNIGLPLPAAAHAAILFTDVEQPGRKMCELYAGDDTTLLLVAPKVLEGYNARVVSARRDAVFLEIMNVYAAPPCDALTVVNLNVLVAHVDRELGIDSSTCDAVA
jgi:hypothetical protein